MIDEHYANPKLAAVYDEDSGWDEGRDYYLALAPETPIDILDLGCGTGLLCSAYAARSQCVTGVDPAQAMLDEARKKTNGANSEDVFEVYAENNSPGAYRIFWHYGPGKDVITVTAITSHR